MISYRYGRITAALNKKFRDTDSKTDNCLQVGSYGRKTGIKGLSDLDMIYIMPGSLWERYRSDGQRRVLEATKAAIEGTFPNTETAVSRLVVVTSFENYKIEVQPCFQQDDGSFLYPDTHRNQWLNTNPRAEIRAMMEADQESNGNLRDLCKMVRAWRNKHGLEMGGLLIDTLAYQFTNSTTAYHTTSHSDHHQMVTDFFEYLGQEPEEKSHYRALGSGQNVRIKKRFQRKARRAHRLCLDAIQAQGQGNCNDKWRDVFGRSFPAHEAVTEMAEASRSFDNTEQFIEDLFPVDIRYSLEIECDVRQDGYRVSSLRELLERRQPLLPRKHLEFRVTACDVPEPFDVKWKVLNRGDEAERRNCIRGQIHNDHGYRKRTEPTLFRGDHLVECYAIKDKVVVAMGRVHVPISSSNYEQR